MPKSIAEKLKVFVSSTSEDLKDYRAAARLAICDMEWTPCMMEHFTAMSDPTVKACQEKLKDCDLMLLIVAFRKGWVPTREQGGDGEKSITALELEFAKRNRIDVLAFRAKDTWPGNLWEKDDASRDWVENFRSELNLVAPEFHYEEPKIKEASEGLTVFRTEVKAALLNYRGRLKETKRPSDRTTEGENFERASARLRSGLCIPFLGHGVYGKGPLSICALRKSLGDEACKSCEGESELCEKSCLAAAAEHKAHEGRDLFLKSLERIVTEQTQDAKVPRVYELLMEIKPVLPLIISTTEDLVFEEKLSNSGKISLILCHIIHSSESAEEGKLLEFKGPYDKNPVPRFADEIDLSAEEDTHIIYKPLGSPLLNRSFENGRKYDTVVMTESDYLNLLRRLEHQRTGVPTAFSTLFREYPPIFLGYPMDVWHFRLVGQVLKCIGQTASGSPPIFAVRIAASRMEEIAWDKLNVKLVPMDPNDFAEKV